MPGSTGVCRISAISSMSTETIVSKAPTRIDLAGGTVDIWPIYLFLRQPVTLNLGIDLHAEARIETRSGDSGVTLRSDDQGHEVKLSWQQVLDGSHAPHPALVLHYKLLRHFAREAPESRRAGLTLSTRAKSPAGAGLGGSSTLSIAMVGALATWATGKPLDPLKDGVRMIELVRDIETTVINVPAGMQDYYGAMFGGLQALRWAAGTHQRDWLPEEIFHELEDRLLLFYSGQSRNSGINNWALFKGFIDGEGEVRSKFERIAAATTELERALLARDWAGCGRAIAEEWAVRRTLAPGITTPEMDQAFAEAARIAPISGKVCGAGGGGCFFIYVSTPDQKLRSQHKDQIEKALTDRGIRALPFKAVPRGVEVQVTRG